MLAFPRLKFVDLEERCPVHLNELLRNVFKFYRAIDIKKVDTLIMIPRILEAKGLVESCRMMVRSLIEPENGNAYIKKYADSFNRMNENLGRYDKLVFDKFEDELTTLEQSRTIGEYNSNADIGYLKIKAFSNHLHNAIEQLVYYPLLSATERYIKMSEEQVKDGLKIKIIKDMALFEYLIFLYLYHASETLGIWTKEDRKTTTTLDVTPDNMPVNVKTRELSDEERIKQAEEFFKNPLLEEENEQVL